jgi:hypothetical protein
MCVSTAHVSFRIDIAIKYLGDEVDFLRPMKEKASFFAKDKASSNKPCAMEFMP